MRWRIIWKFVTFARGIAKFSNFSRLPSTESTSFEEEKKKHGTYEGGAGGVNEVGGKVSTEATTGMRPGKENER